MFIEKSCGPLTRAPAERNVFHKAQVIFRSAGAREIFDSRAFYKHLAPTGAKSNQIRWASVESQR